VTDFETHHMRLKFLILQKSKKCLKMTPQTYNILQLPLFDLRTLFRLRPEVLARRDFELDNNC